MPYSSNDFNFSTDTGTQTLTADGVVGTLAQIYWKPDVPDTGADLALFLDMSATDTGGGFTILNDNDCLGVAFNRVPIQDLHDATGLSDTGTALYVASGKETLRALVTPGGAAVSGRLRVWWKD